MKQTVIRKSKWFWPWQDAQEETWLEQMSQQGLHLKQAHLMAQYDFVIGQPENYIPPRFSRLIEKEEKG